MMDKALELIRHFEGFRSDPYQDTGGVWTIGYGSTRDANGKRVSRDTKPITREQGDALLARDFGLALNSVDHYVKLPLNDNQRGALASFVYNLGDQQFSSSTLLARLNRGDVAGVPVELKRWVYDNGRKLQGLVDRRAAEALLFDTPVEPPRMPQDKPSPPPATALAADAANPKTGPTAGDQS